MQMHAGLAAGNAFVTESGPLPRFDLRCQLCREVLDVNALSAQLGLYRSRAEKVLFENDHFLLIPDISPLAPGHCLLITRRHYQNLVSAPASVRDSLVIAQQHAVRLAATVAMRSPEASDMQVFLFEHGGVESGGGACIDHAHLHILPLPSRLGQLPFRAWLEDYGDVVEVASWADAAAISPGRGGYLFFEGPNSNRIVTVDLTDTVPCQYLRRVLARHLGNRHWNWKSVLHRSAATSSNGRNP